MIKLIKQTVLNFYRSQVLRAYYKRDFKTFEKYLSKIEPHDPHFVRFCKLFSRQYLQSDVTVDEWKTWIEDSRNSHPYIQGRAMMELVTKYLHLEQPENAVEWFKRKCDRFGFSSSDVNACTGIMNFLVKKTGIEAAQAFKGYVLGQIRGKSFEESVKLKLMEVFFVLDGEPQPHWKKAFAQFHETKIYRSKKKYFDELEQTYQLIEKKHPLLLDIRTSAQELETLKNHIDQKLESKTPFQMIRLGDGESYGFSSSKINSMIFNYDKRAREMKWWGRQIPSLLRDKITGQFKVSLYDSDVIGIPGIFRFYRDFFKSGLLSKFGLSVLSQTTQRGLIATMEQVRNDIEAGKFLSSAWFVEHRCHQMLLNRQGVVSFAQKAAKTLIVSQYDSAILQKAFPEIEIDCVQIQAERSESPLPYQMDEISQQVASKTSEGALVLVASGFAGKHFLHIAKKAGGIALDAGSMSDYWVGRKTRQVSDII